MDNKRKIAHTATFNDDPAGSISDLLIWVSFVFAALFVTFALIFPVLDKHKIEYCRHFISEKSQSHHILIQKELAYCTMLIKNK